MSRVGAMSSFDDLRMSLAVTGSCPRTTEVSPRRRWFADRLPRTMVSWDRPAPRLGPRADPRGGGPS